MLEFDGKCYKNAKTIQNTLRMEIRLLILLIISITGSILIEYFGWKMIGHIDGENSFPGFLSLSVIKSIFMNTLGSWIFGLILLAVTALFPAFRRNIRTSVHKPLFVGITLFYLYMAVLITIGFSSIGV